jgi:hypothetical protein
VCDRLSGRILVRRTLTTASLFWLNVEPQNHSLFSLSPPSNNNAHTSPHTIHSFIFIAYLVALQLFLFYVRLQAKSINDRTPIAVSNPFSKILETTKNAQVKSLASSLLTSQSTVLEYDLAQIKSMNGGLLVNMGFMWFLHYKMGQVQPLFQQTISGVTNMVYSPLFQVYVLGRNLERPFKTPSPANKFGANNADDDEATTEEDDAAAATDDEEEEDESDDDEEGEEEEQSDDEEEEDDSDDASDDDASDDDGSDDDESDDDE